MTQVRLDNAALCTRLHQLLEEFAHECSEVEEFQNLYRADGKTDNDRNRLTLLLQGQQIRRRQASDLVHDARSHFLNQMASGYPVSDQWRRFIAHMEHRACDERRPLETLMRLAKCLELPPSENQAFANAAPPQPTGSHRTTRQPDFETSRRRLDMAQSITRELTTIHQAVQSYTTVRKLRQHYPNFQVWKILPESEQRELLDGKFLPKVFAERLVMREFGLTSPETLRKDRKKLRAHEAELSAVPISPALTNPVLPGSYPDCGPHTECRNGTEMPADKKG